MKAGTAAPVDEAIARSLADRFIVFLETGEPPAGLFQPDVFCDFTMPLWRIQAQGPEGVVALRRAGHPAPGQVVRPRCRWICRASWASAAGTRCGTCRICSARRW